jgi:[protein-PII] uridylyltransferase
VKNGQGGLRDLDIVHWAAQARWRVRTLDELVPLKVLTAREFEQIDQASAFLGRVRNILHYKSPRRTERMGFEAQEVVALAMGYGKGGAACEAMMSDYYRHARNVSNAREAMLFRAEPPSRKKVKEKQLDGGVILRDDRVALKKPSDMIETFISTRKTEFLAAAAVKAKEVFGRGMSLRSGLSTVG